LEQPPAEANRVAATAPRLEAGTAPPAGVSAKVAPTAPGRFRARDEAFEFGLLFLMVSPNLVWILLDRGKWVSDTSLYALGATNLHFRLLHDRAAWWSEMLAISPKPPILPWVGQFFVEVGRILGNVDVGLLLVIFTAHVGGLWFLHRALMAAFGRRSLARLGCLMVAAAPMFILLSSQFYVQPVQLFAVCWFLWIMVSSKRWDSLLTLLHLGAASSVAVLATMSSPAYCLVPGSIALGRAFQNRGVRIRVRGAHVGIAMFGAAAAGLAVAWYLRNFDEAVEYGRFGYSFAYAAEVKGVFAIKLAEWGRLLLYGFLASGFVALLFPWASLLHRREDRSPRGGAGTVMLLLAVQVALVLLLLASSAHQTFRYLLPLAPYFAIVGCWNLAEIEKKWLVGTTAAVLSVQLLATHALLYLWDGGFLARERLRYVAALEAVTEATADDPTGTVWLGIGELGVFNFDLAYHASKSPDYYRRKAPCYRSFEISLTSTEIDGDVEAVWKQIEASRGVTIVLLRRPPPLGDGDANDVWQKVIRSSRDISDRVRRSAKFEKMETPDSWEVEIYREVGGGDSS
jgi:4-amino-4-deoxy-L-arabinose transferase-like glycosyltransferase